MGEIALGRRSVGLEGVTGVGKSALLFEVARQIHGQGFTGLVQLNAAQLTTENLCIAAIYSQLQHLSIDSSAKIDKLKDRITAQLPDTLRKLLGAVVEDLAKAASVKAEKTVGVLRDVIAGKDARKSVEETLVSLNEDNQRYFIKWYLEAMAVGGNPIVIAIDNFEAAENGLVQLVRMLVREQWPDVAFLVAQNIESGDNTNWDNLAADIRATSGKIFTVNPLPAEDISGWFTEVVNRPPTKTELDSILAETGGRSFAIKTVIEAIRDGADERILPDYAGYAERTRRALTSDSREVSELLSMVNRDAAVSIKLLATAAHNLGVKNFGAALDQLSDRRQIAREGESISLSHSIIHDSWRKTLTEERIGQLGDAWFAAVSGYSVEQLTSASSVGILPAIELRLVEGRSGAEIADLSQGLMAAGQYSVGFSLLDRSWKYPQGAAKGDGTMIQYALLAARTRLELGRYADVDEPLSQVEGAVGQGTDAAIEALLLRMKLSLRRNSYSALWPLVVRLNAETSDQKLLAEGELIVNTAYRDLLMTEQLQESVNRLDKLYPALSSGLKNQINRARARSQAKLGQLDSALNEAMAAVETSLELDSIRAVGNAKLAMAEVRRYRTEYDIALPIYEEAIQIGRAYGNRDSELWSLLGQAATYIALADKNNIEQRLASIRAYLAEPGYQHPLETAHANLLATLGGIPIQSDAEILRSYSALGIDWPKKYLPVEGSTTAPKGPIPL